MDSTDAQRGVLSSIVQGLRTRGKPPSLAVGAPAGRLCGADGADNSVSVHDTEVSALGAMYDALHGECIGEGNTIVRALRERPAPQPGFDR